MLVAIQAAKTTVVVMIVDVAAVWVVAFEESWLRFAECFAATSVVADAMMAAEQPLTAVAAATKLV